MSWCGRCGRQVDWGRTVAGELVAIDPAPLPDGTLMALPDGRLREVPPEKRADCPAPLYRNHRSSCGSAAA